MLGFQVFISQCNNYRHSSLKSINHNFEFLSYWIRWQVLFNSIANLGKLVCFCRYVFSVYIRKFLLDPSLGLLLPLLQRTPHYTTQLKLLAETIQVLKLSCLHLEHFLVVVKLARCDFQFLESGFQSI